MRSKEIIDALLEQARDKEMLANGDRDSVFADDAAILREAAKLLQNDNKCYLAIFENGYITKMDYVPTNEGFNKKNQIIPIDEFEHYQGYAWLETRDPEFCDYNGWPVWLDGEGGAIAELGLTNLFNDAEDFAKRAAPKYNKIYRYWLMPPTKEERKRTPWEINDD